VGLFREENGDTAIRYGPEIEDDMEEVPTPTFLPRLRVTQTPPIWEPVRLGRLFLFVAFGCTNLAGPVAAASISPSHAALTRGIRSVLNPFYSLKELSPIGTGDAAPEGGGTAPQQTVTTIASINKTMTNQEVTVQAEIANVRVPRNERAPYVVTLTQDGATIPLVFWSDLASSLTPKIKDGNLVRAKVTIGEYRSHLQLRLRNAANLEVVGPATATSNEAAKPVAESASVNVATNPAPALAHVKAAVGEIKRDWIDRVVTISGTISASDNIGSGQRLRVQDGTGEIQVVLWENVLGGVAITDLQPGRVITVTGPVKLYRGTIEIVPETATGVKLESQ